jgi:hypothetical protein
VLESQVVAADIGRVWRARLGECEQLDRLLAESKRTARACAPSTPVSRAKDVPAWRSISIGSKPNACR